MWLRRWAVLASRPGADRPVADEQASLKVARRLEKTEGVCSEAGAQGGCSKAMRKAWHGLAGDARARNERERASERVGCRGRQGTGPRCGSVSLPPRAAAAWSTSHAPPPRR